MEFFTNRRLREKVSLWRNEKLITCGVPDITDWGIGGIVVGCSGCFAKSWASILFFSHRCLFIEFVPDTEGCDPSRGRFIDEFIFKSSADLLREPWEFSLDWDGDAVVVWKPRLFRRWSSPYFWYRKKILRVNIHIVGGKIRIWKKYNYRWFFLFLFFVLVFQELLKKFVTLLQSNPCFLVIVVIFLI